MKSVQAMATVTPVVELILVAGMLGVLWFGGRSVLEGRMTPGGLVALSRLLGDDHPAVGYLTRSLNLLQQATSAAERITALLQAPREDATGGETRLERVEGRVTFERVTFSYIPGKPVLKDVTLEALPGKPSPWSARAAPARARWST